MKIRMAPLIFLATGLGLLPSFKIEAASSRVVVTGKIVLPRLSNPRNLYQNKMLLKPTVPGGSCSGNNSYAYEAVPQASLNLGTIFEVTLIPLDPKNMNRYPAQVSSDGTFSASVPASLMGYCASANADKTHLSQCLTQAFLAGTTKTFQIDLRSTLLSRLALRSDGLVMPTPAFSTARLEQMLTQLEATFSQRISGSIWAYAASAILGQLGISITPMNATYYTEADKAPFALYSPNEVLSPNIINFNDTTTANLLTNTYSSTLKFSVSEGSTAQVTKLASGNVKISHLKAGQTLDLVLPSNNVRTVGFRLANGSGPGASSIRRAFRFRAYDRLGNQIGIPLQWYTHQPTGTGAASFFGITVNSEDPTTTALECLKSDGKPAYCENPIYRISLSLSPSIAETESQDISLQSQGDPFYIDDFYFSTKYSPLKQLGWVSNGFEIKKSFTPDPNGTFNHWLSNRDDKTSPDPENSCTWENNFSGNSHWHAPYPSSAPTSWKSFTLMSPAITLSNLPLDSQDTVNTNTWLAAPLSVPQDLLWKKIVQNTSFNTCSTSYAATKDPNDPVSWNDPFAPVEWTYANPVCVIASGMAGTCPVSPWNTWGTGMPGAIGSSTMNNHWSHVHWQQFSAIEASKDQSISAHLGKSATTKMRQEYSTDNGSTWRTVYWNPDEDHRGRNGIWYHLHEHPFSDSDIQAYIDNYKSPWDPNPATPKRACKNTDFWKSGWRKTQSPYTNGVYNYDFLKKDASGKWIVGTDGKGARDNADSDWDGECREWEAEFYQDYAGTVSTQNADSCCRNPSFLSASNQAACTQVNANGCYTNQSGTPCSCADDPMILGTTMRYRFVFETNAAKSQVSCYRIDGVAIECDGIRIDDVSINNDSLEGYYTDFDSFYDPNLGASQ